MNLPIKDENIFVYNPDHNKRYKFKTLHRIDWVQLNDSLDDLWSDYLPSRLALQRLQSFARAHQRKREAAREATGKPQPAKPVIVYTSRRGVREVQQEMILIDMFRKE